MKTIEMPRMTIGHTKCKCQSACAIIIHKFPSYSSWFFFVGFLVYFHIIIILNIRKEQRAHSFKRYGIKYFIMKRKKNLQKKLIYDGKRPDEYVTEQTNTEKLFK